MLDNKNIWEENVIIRKEESLHKKNVFDKFNKAFIAGKITENLKYSHEKYGKKFDQTKLKTDRLSGTQDLIPIIIPEGNINTDLKDKWVEVIGQFRSYNSLGKDGRVHVTLYLDVKCITIYENLYDAEDVTYENLIYLSGTICKTPQYRITYSGTRKLTTFIIAVHGKDGKSDYLPCAVWGDEALKVKEFKVGEKINLYGRIQSRTYFKRNPDNPNGGEYKDAYEISAISVS